MAANILQLIDESSPKYHRYATEWMHVHMLSFTSIYILLQKILFVCCRFQFAPDIIRLFFAIHKPFWHTTQLSNLHYITYGLFIPHPNVLDSSLLDSNTNLNDWKPHNPEHILYTLQELHIN